MFNGRKFPIAEILILVISFAVIAAIIIYGIVRRRQQLYRLDLYHACDTAELPSDLLHIRSADEGETYIILTM